MQQTSRIPINPARVKGFGKMSFIPAEQGRQRSINDRWPQRAVLTIGNIGHNFIWFGITGHRDDRRHMIKLANKIRS